MGKVKEMSMYAGRRALNVTDCEGYSLNEGDVVAEGKTGDLIWDGQAKISVPVLAHIVVNDGGPFTEMCDIADANLVQLESGEAILTENAAPELWNMAGPNGEVVLYLNTYDGQYEFKITNNRLDGLYYEGILD